MADPDYSDPCVAATLLKAAYYRLIAGEREVKVKFGDREVQYAETSVTALQAEITRLEGLCAKRQGGGPRRHAMRLGSFARPT